MHRAKLSQSAPPPPPAPHLPQHADPPLPLPRAPDWFQAEERRCNRFTMPLTKEEIGAAKSQFNSINARTIKKVRDCRPLPGSPSLMPAAGC